MKVMNRPSGAVGCGRARTVSSLSGLAVLGPSDVLVADRLPPTWVPLLPSVAGVVLATGGVLSNTAILLRERGIPAVVGLGEQVARLQPGDLLEVDGVAGVVRRLGAA